jgi:anti-anti-sigma factor
LTIRVQVRGDGLAVSRELDMASADDFREFAKTAIDPTREVVLNIANLEFVDSAGVRAILRMAEAACPNGVVLRWPRNNVLRTLEILAVERCREYEYNGGRMRRSESAGLDRADDQLLAVSVSKLIQRLDRRSQTVWGRVAALQHWPV